MDVVLPCAAWPARPAGRVTTERTGNLFKPARLEGKRVTVPNWVFGASGHFVLIVPGFVYQAVRIRLRGRTPADTELSTRIVHAIVTSTTFALLYLLAFGPQIMDAARARGDILEHPASPQCWAWLPTWAADARRGHTEIAANEREVEEPAEPLCGRATGQGSILDPLLGMWHFRAHLGVSSAFGWLMGRGLRVGSGRTRMRRPSQTHGRCSLK